MKRVVLQDQAAASNQQKPWAAKLAWMQETVGDEV
jgi:hypothetical protein